MGENEIIQGRMMDYKIIVRKIKLSRIVKKSITAWAGHMHEEWISKRTTGSIKAEMAGNG